LRTFWKNKAKEVHYFEFFVMSFEAPQYEILHRMKQTLYFFYPSIGTIHLTGRIVRGNSILPFWPLSCNNARYIRQKMDDVLSS